MCFELVELYSENSLFLLKACLCNDRINASESAGEPLIFTPLVQRDALKSSGIFAFCFICMRAYLHIHIRVR